MDKIKKYIRTNWNFLIIIIPAIFLRLYRLSEFATFLSDQGRDAIIVKRIVTFSHLPAIGAASSVGQVYLGPFYYYLIAPFLPLFNFDPVGLAYGVALLSIIGIIAMYLIVKKEFDSKTALFFLLFMSFSFVNIEASRFSWNPNLLPFFSFLTLYWFYRLLLTKRIIYAVLFGSFFSFAFQLHYLAALLVIPIIIFSIKRFFDDKTKKRFSVNMVVSVLSFVFFSLPLVIFDLRHDFLNVKNLVKLFTEQGALSNGSFIDRLILTVRSFLSFFMMDNISPVVAMAVTIGLICIFIFLGRQKKNIFLRIHFVHIFTYLLFFSLLSGPRHAHYYHPLYFSFFLVTAYLFALSVKKIGLNILTLITALFFGAYIFMNLKSSYFIYGKPNNQISHAKKVADFLAEKIGGKPFNISTWPVEFFEDGYLYFLELKGIIPADRSKVEITNQMFVLCNKAPCQVIDSPSWNISMFGKAKIDTIWEIEGVTIYKLIHDR